MKVYIALLLSLLIGVVAGGFVTYQPTRDRAHSAGEGAGREAVLRDLCALAIKGAPPGEADYTLDGEASRLSAVKDGDAVQLYCEE